MADDLAASTQDTVYRAVGVVAAGVRQRWLVVYRRAARLQAEAGLRRQPGKPGDIELKAFDRLRRQRCACEADAQAALEAVSQGLTLPEVQEGGIVPHTPPVWTGRPVKHHEPDTVRYAVEGPLASRIDVHARRWPRQSGFIVATHDTVGAVSMKSKPSTPTARTRNRSSVDSVS